MFKNEGEDEESKQNSEEREINDIEDLQKELEAKLREMDSVDPLKLLELSKIHELQEPSPMRFDDSASDPGSESDPNEPLDNPYEWMRGAQAQVKVQKSPVKQVVKEKENAQPSEEEILARLK